MDGVDRPIRLVVDTGAPTVLRAAVAARVSKRPDPSANRGDPKDAYGRPIAVNPILIDRLSIGTSEFESVPASVIQTAVFDLLCPPVDGLLGTRGLSASSGIFERAAVEIDRDRGRLRILGGSVPRGDREAVLPLRAYWVTRDGEKIDDTTFWIPMSLQGSFVWAVLDTGGGGISKMTVDVFRALGHSTNDDDVFRYVGSYGSSVGGSSPSRDSWITLIRDVRLGKLQLPVVPFRIVEAEKGEVHTVALAENLLRAFNMVFDHPRDEVHLRPHGAALGEAMLPTQLGWDVRDGEVVVVGMLEDGAARKAGIALGDELVRMGDADVDVADPRSVCAARHWRSTPGDPVPMRLRRNGVEFDVAVPKAETDASLAPSGLSNR